MLQYHSILPQSGTHLRRLNCKQSKPFKCFNISTLVPFFFQESLWSFYFPTEYLFTRKKQLPGVFIMGSRYFPINKYVGVVSSGSIYLRWLLFRCVEPAHFSTTYIYHNTYFFSYHVHYVKINSATTINNETVSIYSLYPYIHIEKIVSW